MGFDTSRLTAYKKFTERGCDFMHDLSMPLWERYLLTIEEASIYFRIGENKLRQIANEYKEECVLQNGNRMLIKKRKFEKIIDELEQI